MAKKIPENFFCFWNNCVWIGCVKLSLLRRAYLSSTLSVLTNSLKILHMTKRDFFRTQFRSQWSINFLKVLSFSIQHCLGLFTMFLPEGFFETGLFRQLSNHVFRSPWFGKCISYRVIFFCKCSKFNINFKNGKRISEKFLCFCDNCIWTSCVKPSLFRGEYLSSAVNLLTTSLNIFHITKRDFSLLCRFHSDQ